VNDHELEQLAQRLGARAAERLDVERAAQAVLTRLREEPRRPVAAWVWMQPAWLKIAATAVLVLGGAGGGLVVRGLVHEPAATTAVVMPMGDELSDLTAEQLRETMRSLEQPLTGESTGSVETGLDGLSTDELRALLRTLEG